MNATLRRGSAADPRVSVSPAPPATITVFPSLTESGRYRAEFRFRYEQEIVTDFIIALSGWYSYDSRAPVGSAGTVSQDDYGLVTSLGWEF